MRRFSVARRSSSSVKSLNTAALCTLVALLPAASAHTDTGTAPVSIKSGVIHQSGTTVSVVMTGDLLPALDAKNFCLEIRSGGKAVWINDTLAGAVTLHQGVADFGLTNAVPSHWQARLSYCPAGVGKPSIKVSLDNKSLFKPEAQSTHGTMFLATRGFARTSTDNNNVGKEAQTLHRQEMPYGASPGWLVPYQGFSDGNEDSVVIMAAGAWIKQSANEPAFRIPLKFKNAFGTTIAPNDITESDPVSIPLLPGAVVWITTWYKAGLPTTGLPYQTSLYIKESTPGAEDRDGTMAGAIGTLTDHTLSGGFDHSQLGGPLSAGLGYLARGYRPMAIVGKPHPVWRGVEVVPIFLGDSINVQQNDFFDDDTTYCMRGFNGRFCADKYPYLVFGQGGSASGGFVGAVGTPLFAYIFGADAAHPRKVTHGINEYGINSMRLDPHPEQIAANQWADRQRVAAVLHDLGVPYIHCTITPCEQQWTNWPTDNGGPKDAIFATFVQQRQALNEMMRTQSATIPGCIGFIDPCSALETDPKSGSNQWVVATKGDGIHPNSVGHQAYAGTILPALFIEHPNPIPVALVQGKSTTVPCK